MKNILVKDLMIPIDEYATVYEGELLSKAVLALEKSLTNDLRVKGRSVYPHRAILVLNKSNKVVGKLSQLDILKALEPKYQEIISADYFTRTDASGLSIDFIQNMVEQYHLFKKPLKELVRRASTIKVENCMYVPSGGEVVNEEDNLGLAINQLIVGKHRSLLVMRRGRITGILRLADIFQVIYDKTKSLSR